jgi:hypothetical protein
MITWPLGGHYSCAAAPSFHMRESPRRNTSSSCRRAIASKLSLTVALKRGVSLLLLLHKVQRNLLSQFLSLQPSPLSKIETRASAEQPQWLLQTKSSLVALTKAPPAHASLSSTRPASLSRSIKRSLPRSTPIPGKHSPRPTTLTYSIPNRLQLA